MNLSKSTISTRGVTLDVDLSITDNQVNPYIYAQFLENGIGHSIDGLWGEQIRNRSFLSHWRVRSGILECQLGISNHTISLAGNKWENCAYTLEAQNPMLIVFRAKNKRSFYAWEFGKKKQALIRYDNGIPAVLQQIETGIQDRAWHRFTTRMNGSDLRCFIDGSQILSAKDTTYTAGRVGVGALPSNSIVECQYKNMEIRDLATEKLLWNGPTVDMGAIRTLEKWLVIKDGRGAVSLVPNDGENSGNCVQISEPSAWSGISQKGLSICNSWPYKVLVRVKSIEFSGTLRARFTSSGKGRKLFAEQTTSDFSSEWGIVTFNLAPSDTDNNAIFTLTAQGTGKLQIDAVSLMGDKALAINGFRPDVFDKVDQLKPTLIRWPGGCFASVYRWKNGIGPWWKRKANWSPWKEWDEGAFGIDEFIPLCRLFNAEPVIVVNLGTWDDASYADTYMKEAIEWVEYLNGDTTTSMGALRAQNGHPKPYNVKYIELDNEVWGLTVDEYVKRFSPFVDAVSLRWPSIQFFASAYGDPWGKDKQLLDSEPRIDFLSLHIYLPNQDSFDNGPGDYAALWDEYGAMIPTSGNPGARVAFNEWGFGCGNWRAGLLAAGTIIEAEKKGIIAQIAHGVLIDIGDGTGDNCRVVGFDSYRSYHVPNGIVMKLFREHYQPYVLRMTNFPSDPYVKIIATRNAQKSIMVVKAVNSTAEDFQNVAVRITNGKFKKDAKKWLISAVLDDRNALNDPDNIAPVYSAITAKDTKCTFSLPAYSVCVIELELVK